MKHKGLYLFVTILILLFPCSCSDSQERIQSDKPQVVAVSFIQYDFVREIAKDKVDVKMLILPGAEVHTYEPTPMDVSAILNCNLSVRNGGVSETWLDSLSIDVNGIPTVKFMDVTDNLCSTHNDHDSDSLNEHSHDIDEHVWTSPKNAVLIANAICSALVEIDKENQEFYKENTRVFIEKLEKLDNDFSQLVQNASRKTVVVGDRFPFLYLANHYNLEYHAAFSGCASNTEPTASDILRLTQIVKNQNLPVVFKIEFSNGSVAKTIAEQTGASVLLLHSCHNVTKEEFENGAGYLSLMNQNLENLLEALY